MWSTYNAGEIKGGGVLRNQILIVLGGAIAFGFLVAITSYFINISAGYEFINAMSYHYTNGTSIGTLPFAGSSFLLFMAVLSSSPIILIILLFTFVVQQVQYFFSLSIPQIRVLFAMSFDRILPEKLTAVSEKLQSPWAATAFVGGLEILWILLYLNVSVITTYFTVMMFTTTFVMLLTQICGILLPYRAKAIFESSPIRKYKVAGVPAVTITGILGLISASIMEFYYFTVPIYGGISGNSIVIALNVGLVLACGIYYYLARWYRKRQGINVDLAFKEVPPE
jgi:amino acid transporter